MNTLTLTEIAPYLPFGLKVKNLNHKIDYVGKEYGEVNGFYPLYKDGQPIWHYTTTENSTGAALSDCLPLLFPISSLTKPMDDGRVPIQELMNIALNHVYDYVPEYSIDIFASHGVSARDGKWNYGFSFSCCHETNWIEFRLTVNGDDMKINQLALFQELAKMHIDFQGLTERGLAIDATTLNVNP